MKMTCYKNALTLKIGVRLFCATTNHNAEEALTEGCGGLQPPQRAGTTGLSEASPS